MANRISYILSRDHLPTKGGSDQSSAHAWTHAWLAEEGHVGRYSNVNGRSLTSGGHPNDLRSIQPLLKWNETKVSPTAEYRYMAVGLGNTVWVDQTEVNLTSIVELKSSSWTCNSVCSCLTYLQIIYNTSCKTWEILNHLNVVTEKEIFSGRLPVRVRHEPDHNRKKWVCKTE